jgi:hypothetical protein
VNVTRMVKPLLEEFDFAGRLLLFCGSYGLLGAGQAQIVDIQQEASWGSAIWHLISEYPAGSLLSGVAGHALADTLLPVR